MGILASTSHNSNYPPCSCSCRQAVLYFHHSTPTGHARAHRQAALYFHHPYRAAATPTGTHHASRHLFYIAIRSYWHCYMPGAYRRCSMLHTRYNICAIPEGDIPGEGDIWVSAHIRNFVPGGYARKWIWLPCTLYKHSTGYDNNIIATLFKGIKPPYFTRSWHISIVTIKAI